VTSARGALGDHFLCSKCCSDLPWRWELQEPVSLARRQARVPQLVDARVRRERACRQQPSCTLPRGLDGSFEATDRLVGIAGGKGDTGNATVVVAQRAASGSTAWPGQRGEWSFRFISSDGWGYQWIQQDARSENCWRKSISQSWTCSGPILNDAGSIGWILATIPFIQAGAVVAIGHAAGYVKPKDFHGAGCLHAGDE